MLSKLLGLLVVGTVLFQILKSVYRGLTSPLSKIPGPFLARFSRLWYLWRVYLGRWEHDNIGLHRKYGPVVRVAPNMYSIDSPEIVKKVYGLGVNHFPKSDWYDAWKHPHPDQFTLFPDRNLQRHAETRKRFQGLYSMSSVVTYEPQVDKCTRLLDQQFTRFAEEDTKIDLARWLQYYAFDVIGNINYSEGFGFLERGDEMNLIPALHSMTTYGTLVGVYPKLHPLLFACMNRLKLGGAAARTELMSFVQGKISHRRTRGLEKTSGEGGENGPATRRTNSDAATTKQPTDFLQKLLAQHQNDPQKVTDYHLFTMGLSNIFAGSDTTAISLSAILYYLLKDPVRMKKLRQEVEQVLAREEVRPEFISFHTSQHMRYLQAVIKESLRLHSATGLPLWRVMPTETSGVEICGHVFPPGTVVGLNNWCAHYNRSVFGDDADDFRPERWMEGDTSDPTFQERLERMNAYYLPYGLGSRTCLGRHIAHLEMSKLIPQILLRFEFKPESDIEMSWATTNRWFVKPDRFLTRIRALKQA